MKDTDYTALIPELPEWNDGAGIDAHGFICGAGDYQLAIGYSLVFWPDFIEFEGYVFRESHFSEDNLRGWERSPDITRRGIEAVINHVHLLDIHTADNSATELQLRYLGRVLREILETKLKRDFPGRSFEVVFYDEPGLDLYEYQVTFWQAD